MAKYSADNRDMLPFLQLLPRCNGLILIGSSKMVRKIVFYNSIKCL